MKTYRKISLSGQWELCWNETGSGKFDEIGERLDAQGIACPVPGDVHMALVNAGVIPEPLTDIHNEDCRWVENQEFWYRKKFCLDADFLGERTELEFEGLDLTADIWLNGQYVGSHNNAFIEKVIDVSHCLRAGENELVVHIDDGVNAVKDKPLDFAQYAWNNEQPYRMWMRKPQYVYGWDWTIWMPTCGIWKDVSLRTYTAAAIRDVLVKTEFDGDVITRAKQISLSVCAQTEFFRGGDYTLRVELSQDPRFDVASVVAVSTCRVDIATPGEKTINATLPVQDPKLWWPNGSGEAYLYTVRVTIEDANGNALHTDSVRHGLRTVGITEDVLDEKSKSFTFTINGQRIFCKGANHVPADCLLGRITDEKTRTLLRMAAQGNMNMVRVWGGGVYESDCFMDTCDELGIMVWHDFMFACGFYPDHVPEYYEEIRREATAAIKRLRRHASLVGWSGNNEIQEMYRSVKQWHPEQAWNGGRLYEQLLPQLVAQLCPDRIYRPSSPYGGETADSYDEGDQHTWHFTHRPGWEHYLDLWRFTDFDFKFLSEFGIIGAMNIESAKECISADALRTDSPQWLHHTNSCQEHKLLDVFVDTYFGGHENLSVQEYILKSQVVQAEIMRHIYDELRSRKFRCSGVLLWTLSDSYGIHNWSVIDYYLRKRPVYYYLKRSMAPLNLSFHGYEVQNFDGTRDYAHHYRTDPTPIGICVANDALCEKQFSVCYRIVTFDGKVLKTDTVADTIAANSVKQVCSVEISDIAADFDPERTILYAQILENGETVNENHYFFAPYGKLKLAQAKISAHVEQIGQEKAKLTLCADTFVWMAHMHELAGVEYSDNDFVLLSGQARTITLTGAQCDRIPAMDALNPKLTVCQDGGTL